MPSINRQILARVKTALEGAAIAVFVDRQDAVSRDECPCIVLTLGDSQRQRFAPNTDKVTQDVLLMIHVRGDPWGELADAVKVQAHSAIYADAQLKVWAEESQGLVAETPAAEQSDETAGKLLLTYRFIVLGAANDLTAFAR
jgi:hypothetical protein